MKVHHVWYPLYDTPVTVEMSREQLFIVMEVLRGKLSTSKPSWREYIAEQFEKVLDASMESGEQEQSNG